MSQLKTWSEECGQILSDLLKYELNSTYCREKAKVSEAVKRGDVLARDAASGEYKIATGASDAIAVAVDDADANATTAVFRRAVVLSRDAVNLPDDATQAQAIVVALGDKDIVLAETA